ncbi:mas-related G-protein coupled receptor member X4-like [Varanus komodoensis]|uniref:mas-related G-protein coupled receptor member X4-like n=1 Tax=Varanus komodoensis TaxID=61221 RepID=UPI001CF767D3|nr:mas-related G-protein coupled receptor member X4-like [Varanus komodoensis]
MAESVNPSYPPTMDYTEEHILEGRINGVYDSGHYALLELVIFSIAILICMLGWVGNGHASWLLGFRIKGNAFTTYFLNMAVADFGSLVFLSFFLILCVTDFSYTFFYHISALVVVLQELYLFTFTASLCFLTVISVERCLAVLFPTWYSCRRPTCLSSRISFLIWTLCTMFYGMQISFFLVYYMELKIVTQIMFIVNYWALPPLLCLSTLVLLAKICCSSQRQPVGSLNTVILLLLLFVLLFRGPWVIAYSIYSIGYSNLFFILSHLVYSICCSIKPIFYHFVGRKCRYSPTEPLEAVFQRVFQDEVYSVGENEQTSASTTGDVTC